jgi:DNA adenine methylase
MKDKYVDIFFPEKKFDTFIDCFFGAGAISHWILDRYPETNFIINDFNTELIQLYRTLATEPEKFIEKTKDIEHEYISQPSDEERKKFYNVLKMRHVNDFSSMSDVDIAAGLFFMLKTNFNGWWKIYGYSNGRYATPPGVMKHTKPFIDYENVKNNAEFLATKCTILNGDFEGVRPHVTDSSFVYFDPPYRDSTTHYTEDGFNDEDQIRLCKFFDECSKKGALAALSNKEIGDGFFESHLGGYSLNKMDVKYTAGRGTTTNSVAEILVTNFKPEKTMTLAAFFE